MALAAVRAEGAPVSAAAVDPNATISSAFAALTVKRAAGQYEVMVKTRSGDVGTIEGTEAWVLASQVEGIRAGAAKRQDEPFVSKVAALDVLITDCFGAVHPSMRAGVSPRGENVGYVEISGSRGTHSLVARKNASGSGRGHVISGFVDGVSFTIQPGAERRSLEVIVNGRVGCDRTLVAKVTGEAAERIFKSAAKILRENDSIRASIIRPE